MADHTAPNYYEQVARESAEKIKTEDEKIASCVLGVTERKYKSLRFLLEHEFGAALMRNANLSEVFDLLCEVAAEGAEIGKGIMISSHHEDAQKSASSVLNTLMAGVGISQGQGSPNEE